ncbi:MAG TPA: PAS domain S-box protein [Ramlibacter sp.]|nr:PAS domain S-box protein [Ramlibacter sp.]
MDTRPQTVPAALTELGKVEERMRSIVDHTVDGIISIVEHGTITTFNRAAERIFGYGAGEVIGKNVKMLMPEPEQDEHDEAIANYVRTGHAKIIGVGREVMGRRKDGTLFPMELAISEFRQGDERHFTGIVRDITDRKSLEHELRQRLHESAEVERQKNEFLAMLGHELRNPLGPMRNALHILKMPAAGAVADRARDVLDRQMQHLIRLVDDLLDVSRIARGKVELRKEVIDLREAVRHACETAQPVIDAHGHHLKLDLPAEPCWVEGDAVRLSQVVSNLLTNAAKYTDHGDVILLSLKRDGETATVQVRDSGVGIAAEFLPRIFDLFVQGDRTLARSQGGLGVGLTVVRRLVELHNGKVSAASAGLGKGSEFAVALPIAQAASDQCEHGTQGKPASVSAARKVLVVDDNVDACDSIAMILMAYGYDVRCLYDGLTVLAIAMQWRPDVIILDIGLPGMSGLEVAAQLRQQAQFQSTPLAALTGYGQDEDRRRSQLAGFDVHLTKPVDPQVLCQWLSQQLDAGKRHVPEPIKLSGHASTARLQWPLAAPIRAL